MEKSGQRSTHIKIIDRPVLKSPLRYLFEGSFTLALWALWVYWLMPIFTLLLWVFGFHLYYSENLLDGGLEELLNTLKNGGLAVLLVACVMLGWTYYNYLWFLRRGERRNKSEAIIFDGDIARYFNVDLGRLRRVRTQSIINISIDDDQIILPVAHNKNHIVLKAS
ncbi:MAG: poly-beta-1,6-N-acetyl-D-glucosamine biosynthesis protein PgaD [Desulfobacterales bacterium]